MSNRRARVHASPDETEVAYISMRGRRTVKPTGKDGRFVIQRVKASTGGSYWSVVETCVSETYAIDRATSLALTNHHSYRVALVGKP